MFLQLTHSRTDHVWLRNYYHEYRAFICLFEIGELCCCSVNAMQ